MNTIMNAPYFQDDIDFLNSLHNVTKKTMYFGKDKLSELGHVQTSHRTINKDKQPAYVSDYLYRDALSAEEFTELEKANSFIYATFTTHQCDYTTISFSKRLEIFDTLWRVVFGKNPGACYLEIINDLPQKLYSIEIVRNLPDSGRSEVFSL